MKKFTSIDEVSSINLDNHFKPQITVLGIGGAGTNAVNTMIGLVLSGVKFAVINTDLQSLENSVSPIKLQIGPKITKGLGAGSKPEMGISAAEESIEDIKDLLKDTNLLFITAGMGGGTGTGASQVVARVAKELGILTVAFVTKPFMFEGNQKMAVADSGVSELEKFVDSLVVVSNQNLFTVINERTSMIDAFKVTDNVLYLGVKSITDLLVSNGLVNLDFNDVRSVMESMGRTMIGSAQGEGENRALDVVQSAVINPLLENPSIKGAKKLLINITGGNDLTLHEINNIISYIKDELDSNAFINFGTIYDNELNGKIMLSIVATGLSGHNSEPNIDFKKNLNNLNKNKVNNFIKKEEPSYVETEQHRDRHVGANNYIPRRLEADGEITEIKPNDINSKKAESNQTQDIFSSIMENSIYKDDDAFIDKKVDNMKDKEAMNRYNKNKESSIFDIPAFLKKR